MVALRFINIPRNVRTSTFLITYYILHTLRLLIFRHWQHKNISSDLSTRLLTQTNSLSIPFKYFILILILDLYFRYTCTYITVVDLVANIEPELIKKKRKIVQPAFINKVCCLLLLSFLLPLVLFYIGCATPYYYSIP